MAQPRPAPPRSSPDWQIPPQSSSPPRLLPSPCCASPLSMPPATQKITIINTPMTNCTARDARQPTRQPPPALRASRQLRCRRNTTSTMPVTVPMIAAGGTRRSRRSQRQHKGDGAQHKSCSRSPAGARPPACCPRNWASGSDPMPTAASKVEHGKRHRDRSSQTAR